MPTASTGMVLSQEQTTATRFKRRSIETRRTILKAVKRGMSVAHASKLFKVAKRTIYDWKAQWQTERTLEHKSIPGRPRKLSPVEVEAMKAKVNEQPTVTNDSLIASLGLPISNPSVSNYLKREGYTRKKVSDEPTNWPDDRVRQEIKDYVAAVEEIPFDKRVYMDGSFAYTNEARTHGRSPKGKRISRPRERHGLRLTFLLAVRHDGLAHEPLILKENAKDEVFLSYVKDTLVPALRPGETVIWDRLGRSGRARNPTKQHYNPEARRLIQAEGCKLLFLPPKGKHFNPVEAVFSKIKTYIRNSYTTSIAAQEKRHRQEAELRLAIRAGCAKVTAQDMAGYFSFRGTGKCFEEVYSHVELHSGYRLSGNEALLYRDVSACAIVASFVHCSLRAYRSQIRKCGASKAERHLSVRAYAYKNFSSPCSSLTETSLSIHFFTNPLS